MSEWQPIETAPKDGTTVIVGFDIASVWIVRSACWDDGQGWDSTGFDSLDEARGWWSYCNSVSSEKLEGIYEPTHWMPLPPAPSNAGKEEA